MSSIRHTRSFAAAGLAATAIAGLSGCGGSSAPQHAVAKNTSELSITSPTPPRLNVPSGIAVDPHGYVYVTDAGSGRLVKLSPDGHYLTTVAKFQVRTGASHCEPASVALGARGAIYVFDGCADSIDALTSAGRIVRRYPCPTNGGCDHITLDRAGHVYVNAFYAGVVQRYSLSTGRATVFHRFAAQNPVGLATDPQGHVYVGLVHDDRVVELSASGRELARSAQFGQGPPLNEVDGVALDPHGDVYIETGTDQEDLAVVKLSPSLKRLSTVVRPGPTGHTKFIWGMTVDNHGNLYVGEAGTHRIQKFSSSGKLLAIWH